MAQGPAKGSITPLLHTLQSRQRIITGLRWDPREQEGGLMDRLRGTHYQHDLDTTCFMFDTAGEYMDFVGSEPLYSMDQSGCVYHSGDDMTGEGDGDDEFISAELADLPDDIGHIIFLAEIRTKHTFADVESPLMRLADGMNNKNLLISRLEGPDSTGKMAFIFARIFRDLGSPTGWMLHNISDFPDIADIDDWGAYLRRYIS